MLRLFDAATREVRELTLRTPGKVGIYSCGPTVYGPPHIGHGRNTMVWDILRRYLAWTGLEVQFVSNVTDIEDKIIERAAREGRPWQEITERCEAVWFDAMGRLNVAPPDDIPHATDYVEKMVAMIEALVAGDHAYVTDDGVYLAVETVPDYGLLAYQGLDDLVAGGGERDVFGAEAKRHPADFVLWKLSKPGEPAWPSPWGDGRPGWHSECVVMSLEILGDGFDLHTGGSDLRFPHHENERAQAVALGYTFARHWTHNGFVVDVEGDKMSKSLGNVTNLLDLLDQYDPRAYRMLVLQTHYRSPVRVGPDNLESAVKAVAGLDALAARVATLPPADADTPTLDHFREVMDDDLDTPAASAVLFDVVRRANTALDAGDPAKGASLAAAALEICAALGLVLDAGADIPDDLLARAAALDEARAAKEYAVADSIRAELQARGYLVETSKDGTRLRRA